MLAVDTEVVQSFLKALRSDRRLDAGGGMRGRFWIKKSLLRLDGNRCAYCGKEMDDRATGISADTWSVDHVIPLSLGGPDIARNIVLACHRCNSSKGRREWLLFDQAVDKKDMLRRRAILLPRSLNHFVRNPLEEGWTKQKVQLVLATRWKHPRSAVSALVRSDGVLLGVYGSTTLYPPEVVALLASLAGERFGNYRVIQIDDPKAGLDIIWRLIALNCLVGKVAPEGFSDSSAEVASTPDDALWSAVYRSPLSILWRGRKPGPGKEPTRPGGMRHRRPDGEGWRSQKRLRDLEAMTRAVERGDLDGSRESTPPEIIAGYDTLLDGLVEVYNPAAIPLLWRFHRLSRKGAARNFA